VQHCLAQDTIQNQTEKNSQEDISELEMRVAELEKNSDESDVNMLEKMQLGISFGFNYYFNGQEQYYIKPDSTIGAYGKKRGVSGMLSALMGYKLSEKSSILLNVPLGDLSGNPNQALGIFNKKVAGGLGYGLNKGDISFIIVLNIFPYEKLALEIVEGKKYEQEPYTVADIENMPQEIAYSPSFTLGVCYHFFNTKFLGY
jgi:hypothetical protein